MSQAASARGAVAATSATARVGRSSSRVRAARESIGQKNHTVGVESRESTPSR
jgi:hypothetical protein